MWVEINRYLQRRFPRVHAGLKAAASPWMHGGAPLVPALRRVDGDLFWVHPRVLTSEMARVEPHVARWIAQNLRPGDVFFDVGANCGWLSLMAARRVGRRGRVVAFEPAPVLANILEYHKRVNRMPQLTVVPQAVSDSDSGTTLFLLNHGFSTRNSMTIEAAEAPFVRPEDKTPVAVPSVTLDDFCTRNGVFPSLLKIDVEGAEMMVLEGARGILREHHPILILAVHPFWLPPTQTAGDIFNLLSACEYSIREQSVVEMQGYTAGDYLCSVPSGQPPSARA